MEQRKISPRSKIHFFECICLFLIALTPASSNTSESAHECAVEGQVDSPEQWYGYIANISLPKGGGFRFQFSYPYNEYYIQNILLYDDTNMGELQQEQSCWEKYGVIREDQIDDHILVLRPENNLDGCTTTYNTIDNKEMLTCKAERRYNDPIQLYIAVSNCRSVNGLFLKYRVEFFEYHGGPCTKENI